MSLKAFHIVFVTASTLLAFGFGTWALWQFFGNSRAVTDLVMGITSIVAGVALIVYGKYFLKKLKHISYL